MKRTSRTIGQAWHGPLVAALSGLSLLGCGTKDDTQVATRPTGISPRPLPSCETESYTPCDVGTPACQEAIFATMACLRGNPDATRPESRTLTVAEYAKEIGSSAADDADPALTLAYESCLALLHLVNPGDLTGDAGVDQYVSTVPAAYSPETKLVTFVVANSGATTSDDESAYFMLAHEYVHALQDQELDLTKYEDKYMVTTDNALAIRALVEGEAEIHEYRFLAASWGLDPAKLDWNARFLAHQQYDEEALADFPPYLSIWRSYPYDAGGPFVEKAFTSSGMTGVRALYADPPLASATISYGTQPNPVLELPPAPPSGYELFSSDVLGSALLYDSLSRVAGISDANAATLAQDWRGDMLYFYRATASDSVALVWRLRFGSAASNNLVVGSTSAWKSIVIGQDVLIGMQSTTGATSVLTTLFDHAKNGVVVQPQSSTGDTTEAAGIPRRLLRLPRQFLRRSLTSLVPTPMRH